jgi:hypothetical protein
MSQNNNKLSDQKSNQIQPYPLYDELVRLVEERQDHACIDIKRVCQTCNNIALLEYDDMMNHYSEIEAIILHYDLINNNGVLLSKTPFEGRVLTMDGRGIINNITNMPPKLQQIIAQYIEYFSLKD